jgi:hypothetical protein
MADAMKRLLPTLLLSVLLSATLVLSACGGAPKPVSGIYGMAVVNQGGMIQYPAPSPSPLPDGFGLSTMEPDAHAAIVVTTYADGHAGKEVARIEAGDTGVFRVTLAPGTYLLQGQTGVAKVVTVPPAGFVRVVLQADILA